MELGSGDFLCERIMKIFEFSIIAKDYLALLIMLIIAILLTLVILGFSYLFARQNPDSEKLTAYECGFEPYEDSRHIFDVRACGHAAYNKYF